MVQQATRPLVSIVVRTRNRPRLLAEALSSLVGQSYSPLEVVVVDDGEVELAPVLDEFSEQLTLHPLQSPERLGRARAANRGIEAAAGELLGFLDDDDLLHPGHVEKLASFLATTGEDIAYSDCHWGRYSVESDRLVLVERGASPLPMDFDAKRLRLRNFLPIHSVLFSRRVVERVGPIDESFAVYEDWDFWIRAAEELRFHYLPGVTAEYRRLTDHRYDHLRWHLRIYEKHGFPRGPLQKAWMRLLWLARGVESRIESALRDDPRRKRRRTARSIGSAIDR